MKLLIASDIHGSLYFAKKLVENFKKENADKLVLLGDLYYHGPRNPFPKDYNPMEVANLLNSIKEKLWVIKGNCDSEVDEMISEFKFKKSISKIINGKKVFFSHGHIYNKNNLPKKDFEIMFYGHFHIPFIDTINGKTFCNPGSISLPKNDTMNSYIVFDEKGINIKTF